MTQKLLSVKDAAVRVGRSARTVERWITKGDLNVIEVKNEAGTVVRLYVQLEELLATYRAKILSNPKRKTLPDDHSQR